MSFKSILCAYSGEEAHGSGLNHAIKLARHYDGWLTGVVRHGPAPQEQRFWGQMPERLQREIREADNALARQVSERFTEVMTAAGFGERSDFISCDPSTGCDVPQLARNFDVTVTGVHTDSMENEQHAANPDVIALQSGRPVIVVPNDYAADGLADHAVVAWDGKRAASRALADAFPALEAKSKVTVVTVGEEDAPNLDILMRNIARHGIDVDYRLQPRKGSVAEALLTAAEDVAAKLLVMGAFEHSRFSHNLRGGPTTELMAQSTIPLFLSH